MVTKKMSWGGGIKFKGTAQFGHEIVTDGSKEAGGDEAGYTPTELLLFGVAACAGVDVVRILQKQRQQLEGLEVEVVAHQNDEYPRPFHTLEMKFLARGKNLDPAKLGRAIQLSEDKYCTVSQTVRNQTKVITSYEILSE